MQLEQCVAVQRKVNQNQVAAELLRQRWLDAVFVSVPAPDPSPRLSATPGRPRRLTESPRLTGEEFRRGRWFPTSFCFPGGRRAPERSLSG